MAASFCETCGEILSAETDHRCEWCGGCPDVCSCDRDGEVEVSAPLRDVLEQPEPEEQDDNDADVEAWQETPF
jgi:hypothetical protein